MSKMERDMGLNGMIHNYYDKMRLPRADYSTIVTFVQNLEREIQKVFPGARLNIGGSLCNGFATRESDLDLIFRLAQDKRPRMYDEWTMLEELSDVLTHLGFQTELINAKVKIVKCAPSKYINRSIDICYYNRLALYNVRLLSRYCDWDPRLPVLGLWVKKWIKECNIGDASSGTLSSYAWMIILIHYLQNCSPPVLPRLQQDFLSSDAQWEMIEFLTSSREGEKLHRCDVYFHKIVEQNWSRNLQSVAELFLGFLDYLLNFDFSQEVIQIRQKGPVTKSKKSWTKSILCIEDPFLVSHNLAVRRKNTVIATIWETIRLTKEKFLKTTNYDENLLLKSCKFQGDSRELLRCNECGRLDVCEQNCQNMYMRNLRWKHSEGRQHQPPQAPPSNLNHFHPVHLPGSTYPMMLPSWLPRPHFAVPPLPQQLGYNQVRQANQACVQPQLPHLQQQMDNMTLGVQRNPPVPRFSREHFP